MNTHSQKRLSIHEKASLGQFPLLVSLPSNRMELAHAAHEAQVDGIKVHLNAHHRASGTVFGTFEQERSFLRQLAELPVSRAVMIGQETLPTSEELQALGELGFEGFNLYLKHAVSRLFDTSLPRAFRPILALEHGFKESQVREICQIPGAMIEASIVDPADYGKPLTEEDLAQYRQIAQASSAPVIVPSQKKIEVSDLPRLRQAGVHALLLGVIVTGNTAQSIGSTLRSFHDAIKAQNPAQ